MKSLKIVVVAIIVSVFTLNSVHAANPNLFKIYSSKSELISKIQKVAASTCFTKFVAEGNQENIVIRCIVNADAKVEVRKIIGFNEELQKVIEAKINAKQIQTQPNLCGQEIAFRMRFEKHKK